MKWPWQRTPTPEKRSGQGFTDTIIAGIISQTGGAGASSANSTVLLDSVPSNTAQRLRRVLFMRLTW